MLESKSLICISKIPNDIDKGAIKSLALQIIDAARFAYRHDVTHNDMHMHNLLVHTSRDNPPVLKMIDFGKSNLSNSRNKFSDIRYLFKKEAQGKLESIKRNYVRNNNSEKQQKHYPLHKLALLIHPTKENEINIFLEKQGNELEAKLKHVRTEQDIDDAFNDCIKNVSTLFPVA